LYAKTKTIKQDIKKSSPSNEFCKFPEEKRERRVNAKNTSEASVIVLGSKNVFVFEKMNKMNGESRIRKKASCLP